MHGGIRRLGVNAGHFGERLEQLALDAFGAVFEVALRPGGVGLNRPALDRAASGLGRLSSQPGNAVMGAAGNIPLRAEARQRRLKRLRKRHHQGPAGRYRHTGDVGGQGVGQFGVGQQGMRLGGRQRKHHRIKPGMHASARAVGLELPAFRVELVFFDVNDAGFQHQLAGVKQRLRPLANQGIHARRSDPVRFVGGQRRGDDLAEIVQNPHLVGAPGAHQSGRGG